MSEDRTLTYVGMDVHQDTIAVAVLRPDGRIDEETLQATPLAVRRFFSRFPARASLRTCYEAGPTGYELQRQLSELNVECAVIAPALTPRRAGRRIKTDRRDARSLAGLHRAGQLTAVRVPGAEEEAVRDLVRTREDLSEDILRARHRLSKFLLRHGRVYREGQKKWTQRHDAWVRRQRFEIARLEDLVGHHLAAIEARLRQRELLDAEIELIAKSESYAPLVQRLCCLRGVRTLAALTLLVEVGDFRRFRSAAAFMAFTGLVPSEESSGQRRSQGAITKTGNAHLRRILVEAAFAYRSRPATGGLWRKRVAGAPPELVAYAHAAQQRLHAKYWRLVRREKRGSVASVAVARELAGFVWGVMTERWADPR
jgi:transposase